MFSFLKRSHRQATPRRQADVRLVLESLERRDCPMAPTISLMATPTNSGLAVQLSGTVMDENPAGVTITFSGKATGTTTADATGHYSYTTNASGLGTVSAVGVDQENLTSNTATATISSNAPTISGFTVTYGSQKTVTLSGTVTDEAAGGLTVTFTGKVTGSVQTSSNGTFSFTAVASDLGSVQAQTTDVWGLQSSAATLNLTSNAPHITNFQAIEHLNNLWTFTGQVTDESAAGLIVTLGGIPELSGVTVTVESTGWFSVDVQVAPGRIGLATAQTTDWWGLASNVAEANVS